MRTPTKERKERWKAAICFLCSFWLETGMERSWVCVCARTSAHNNVSFSSCYCLFFFCFFFCWLNESVSEEEHKIALSPSPLFPDDSCRALKNHSNMIRPAVIRHPSRVERCDWTRLHWINKTLGRINERLYIYLWLRKWENAQGREDKLNTPHSV